MCSIFWLFPYLVKTIHFAAIPLSNMQRITSHAIGIDYLDLTRTLEVIMFMPW